MINSKIQGITAIQTTSNKRTSIFSMGSGAERHLIRKTQSAFPMRSLIGKKSCYYLLLPHLENFFLVVSHFAETPGIFRVRQLSRCIVQSANWKLLYTLVLMTIKEAFKKVVSSWKRISVGFSLTRLPDLLRK